MTAMSTVASIAPKPLRLAAVVAFFLLLGALLAGCSASADSAGSAVAGPAEDAAGGAEDIADDGSVPDEAPAANRSLIITGSMYMTVENPLDAADKAASIVKNAGGRVDGTEETAPDESTGGSAKLTLRIPANQLDSVVKELRALGTVDQFSTTASDVTNKVTDLDAHISTLRASTVRIEGLIADAKDISDIIKLEDELASRQAELESLEAEQRGLNDQVSLSTIELSLTTVPVVAAEEPPANFFDGLAAGWHAFTAFVSVALVVVGALLPWLLALAVIGVVVLAIVRWRRTRADNEAAPTAEAPAEAQAPEPANTP
jgi:hypothetical protein